MAVLAPPLIFGLFSAPVPFHYICSRSKTNKKIPSCLLSNTTHEVSSKRLICPYRCDLMHPSSNSHKQMGSISELAFEWITNSQIIHRTIPIVGWDTCCHYISNKGIKSVENRHLKNLPINAAFDPRCRLRSTSFSCHVSPPLCVQLSPSTVSTGAAADDEEEVEEDPSAAVTAKSLVHGRDFDCAVSKFLSSFLLGTFCW